MAGSKASTQGKKTDWRLQTTTVNTFHFQRQKAHDVANHEMAKVPTLYTVMLLPICSQYLRRCKTTSKQHHKQITTMTKIKAKVEGGGAEEQHGTNITYTPAISV